MNEQKQSHGTTVNFEKKNCQLSLVDNGIFYDLMTEIGLNVDQVLSDRNIL